MNLFQITTLSQPIRKRYDKGITMTKPIFNYDEMSDTLYVSFEPGEKATGIELNDHILLRINKKERRAIGCGFANPQRASFAAQKCAPINRDKLRHCASAIPCNGARRSHPENRGRKSGKDIQSERAASSCIPQTAAKHGFVRKAVQLVTYMIFAPAQTAGCGL